MPLWRQQLHYRLKEGALIAVGALCLYLWMALLTYDTSDPGFSHTSNVDQVQNAAGRAGAYFADILFMVLGYFAYIFPLLLAVKTLQIFRERHQPWDWSGWLFSWRLIGLVFLVLSGAALAHIHFHPPASLPFSAGGALGESLGDLARNLLNVQGSTLMFIALFLFGLTVFTDLSWFKVMDVTGKITLDLFELFDHLGIASAHVMGSSAGGMIAGLAARIPHKVAMEMILLCKTLDAQRAYHVGLANEIVPTGQQVERALAMAREIATFSPLVLRTLKRFVNEGVLPQGPSERMARANRDLAIVRDSADAEESLRAFKEKRRPSFQGR